MDFNSKELHRRGAIALARRSRRPPSRLPSGAGSGSAGLISSKGRPGERGNYRAGLATPTER